MLILETENNFIVVNYIFADWIFIMNSKEQNRKITQLGLFTAIAIIFGYVEMLIPIPFPVPGIKLGLANLSILYILLRYTWKEAAVVSAVRIIIVGLMFGSMFSIIYSLAGAAVSLMVMTLLLRFTKSSVPAVSISGGIAHNIGQLIIACLIVENLSLLYYAPVLLIAGMITGLAIGILTKEVQRRVP